MNDVADALLTTLSLAKRLGELDEAAVSARPGPGKWSRKEILGHLIDSAANNHQRFVRMQLVPHLEFPGYAQDDWVRVSGYQSRPWQELVALFDAYNRNLAALLRRADPDSRRHTWTEPDLGPVDLEFVARDYVTHLRHHLAQILAT